MAVEEIVWVNGMSPTDLGADDVRHLAGDAMMAPLSYETIELVRAQGVALTSLVSQDAREFGIAYKFVPSVVEERGNEIATLFDLLTGSLCEIRFGDDPSRVIDAVLVQADRRGLSDRTASENGPAWVSTRWLAPTASKRDRYPQLVSFGSTRVTIPLGGLPPHWEMWIYGAATNPTVTVRDRTGASVASIPFTATLDANDYVRATTVGHRAFLSDNGTETESHTVLAATGFPVLDPRVGASLEVDAGEGLLRYHRRWPL